MPASSEEVDLGVFGRFVETVRQALPPELGGGPTGKGTVRVYFVPNEPMSEAAAPAISMDLVDDTYSGPGQASAGPGTRRPLWTAATRTKWTIRGTDVENARQLRDHLLAAMHKVAHGSYRPEAGTWNTGGVTASGSTYTMIVSIDVPVVRDIEATAKVTAFPQTPEIIDPEDA